MGCQAEIEITPDYCALINHPEQAKLILRIAERLYGAHSAIEREEPSMGAEDFSSFIEQTPGAFYHIGCADPGKMPAPSLHSRTFLLDERCLAVGASMQVAIVNELLWGNIAQQG